MIAGIGLTPQINIETPNFSKRDVRIRFGQKKEIPVLKIDQDRENSSRFNLFAFKTKRLFELATKSLEKLYTILIRKGFIHFSKRESSYYLAQVFRKLIHNKSNTAIYKDFDADYENDSLLNKLRYDAKKKNNALGKISRNGLEDSEVSFDTKKGYRGIVERVTNRPLQEGEQIHHIDHDHNNNRKDNLYLTANQDHHANLHEQLRRIGTILIRKGFINFSRQEGIYKPSKLFDRLLRLKKDSPIYKRAAEKRLEQELGITNLPLSKILARAQAG